MVASIQLNMTRGELTELLGSRIDLDHYRAGMGRMEGWVPLRFGGMTKMPGSIYYGEHKHADKAARSLPFLFSRAQTYRIEVGDLYFRFWNINGRVESPPGTPVEVATPYLEADLKYLQVRQIGDIVYIVCRGYWPRTLTRVSETSWTLALYEPIDGPYLDINTTATTIDPGAASGATTLTASSVVGINGGAGFQVGDIGRPVRFLEAGGRWYWFKITGWTSTTVVSATYMGRDDGDTAAMPGHAASENWRLGSWSAYQGYPAAIGLLEDRLVFGGTTRQPTASWATIPGSTGYVDFSIQSPLAEDDALTAVLSGGQLNSIQWMADGSDLILGTEGSLRALSRNNSEAAFGPLNYRQRPETAVPASYIPGVFIENVLIFLDVERGQLYEAIYSNEQQGYAAAELSALNEHLLGLGITSMAYQKAPFKIIWLTTDDGRLLAATYDRQQEVFGVCDSGLGGTDACFVEDAMTLPGTTKDGDQLWLSVRRVINGATVRTTEVLSAFYRAGRSSQVFPIYGHCAGYYDGVETEEVTDLGHLEGETVGVWADEVDVGDVVITGGVLTLPAVRPTASQIVWGLRSSRIARTLRLAEYGNGEPGVGREINISRVRIDLYQTGTLRIGSGTKTADDYDAGLDYLTWDDNSEQNPYEAVPLRTGSREQGMDDSWENNGVLTIESNSMYPAWVRSIMAFPEGAD